MSNNISPNSSGLEATNSSAPTKQPDARGRLARLHKTFMIAVILLILFSVFSVFALFAVLTGSHLWSATKKSQVLSVQSAGRVVKVTQTTGLITRSLVESDVGFYSLVDSVSLLKNESLTLETRGNQMRLLCDTNHRCTALNDSSWPQ